MIVTLMIVLEHVPGHIGDIVCITAVAVADHRSGHCVAKSILHCDPVDRIGAQHFRINRSLKGKVILRIRQPVAPRLRAVDALILQNHRVQDTVRIKIGKLQKLRLRQTRHGIHGCPVHRHRVHEGVIALINQVEKETVRRILLRSGKTAVLEYMRKTGIVDGIRPERNLERPVDIIVCGIHQLRARLLMLKPDKRRAELRELTDLHSLKAAHLIPDLRQRHRLSVSFCFCFGFGFHIFSFTFGFRFRFFCRCFLSFCFFSGFFCFFGNCFFGFFCLSCFNSLLCRFSLCFFCRLGFCSFSRLRSLSLCCLPSHFSSFFGRLILLSAARYQ